MRTRRVMEFAIGALTLAIATASAAAGNTDDALLRNYLDHSISKYYWEYHQDEAPEFADVLYGWAKDGDDLATLRRKAQEKYRLAPKDSDRLVMATLQVGSVDSWTPASKAAVAELVALSHAYPDNAVIFVEAAKAIVDVEDENCDPEEFHRLLQGRSDPDADRVRAYESMQCLPLMTELTSLHPGDTAPYLVLAKHPDWIKDDWFLLAVQRIADQRAQRDPGIPASVRDEVRRNRLAAEFDEGRFAEGLSLLPEVSTAASVPASFDRMMRANVAAAYLLQGDRSRARVWFDAIAAAPAEPVAEGSYEKSRQEACEWLVKLVELELNGRGDDFVFLSHWFEHRGQIPPSLALWRALFNRMAIGEGYPGLVDVFQDEAAAKRKADSLKLCYRCSEELLSTIEEIAAGEPAPVSTIKPGLPADVLARMDQVMAQPRPAWREQALPVAQRTPRKPKQEPDDPVLAMFGAKSERAETEEPWVKRLPRGTLVRFASQGKRLVALTVSQTLDPTGEVSEGGYWLSVSEDGGEHFAPPLYTGLRMFEPYVVLADSKLPMLDGERIRLEVAVRKLDDENVILPPVMLPFLEQRDDVYLEATLGEIARDSDQDGLTDLAEWAMLLSADIADTDGDGIADGRDTLPLISGKTRIRGADAMAFALNHIMGSSLGALVTTDPTGEPGRTSIGGPGTDVYHADATRFMSAPPAYFAGLRLNSRLIVLDDSMLGRLAKARGLSFTMDISNFEVSHDGNSAVMEWSTGWAGGAFLLTRKGDSWEVEELFGIIT